MIGFISTVFFTILLTTTSAFAKLSNNLHLGFAGNIQVSPNGLGAFVEKYLNASLQENNDLILSTEIDPVELYQTENNEKIFPGANISLENISISQVELAHTKVECFSRNCMISLPIKKLAIQAVLVVNYFNNRIKFDINLGLRDHPELLTWVQLRLSLNTHNKQEPLLTVDSDKSKVIIENKDAFFFHIVNKANNYNFNEALLNRKLLRNLLEQSINDFTIKPIAQILNKLLEEDENLKYILDDFIAFDFPNTDLNGQIDYSANEMIHQKLEKMLDIIRLSPEQKTLRCFYDYLEKYDKYLDQNNIYSDYILDFLRKNIDELTDEPDDLYSEIRSEFESIYSRTMERLENSKRNTFVKLELKRDNDDRNNPNRPYGMSIFLLGNDNESPGFKNIARHGKLYSADEHFVIGGLLKILKLIKLNAKHTIPKAKGDEAVRLLHSYHIEWRKIEKSLRKTSSSDFGEYVLSLLEAIRNHCAHCEKSSHAFSILSSEMMLESFFKKLKLKSSSEELDSFHGRFVLPIRFFNRYMAHLYSSKKFDNIQLDLKEKDILLENARDLIVKFESAPIIKWDPIDSKFMISINEVTASLLISSGVRYTTRLNIDFHFVPDLDREGQIYFRFHKLSSDMNFLPKKEDKFIDKVFSMISMWTFLPQATKHTVIKHIAYTQIKNFLTNLRLPLPDIYVGGKLYLGPTLNTIKYNQDYVFLELIFDDIYKQE